MLADEEHATIGFNEAGARTPQKDLAGPVGRERVGELQ